MTSPVELHAGLKKVQDNFVRSLPARATDVRALYDEIETTGAPGPSEEPARQHLHRIAGVAATLGFAELGNAAGACEDELLRVRDGKAFDSERVGGMLKEVLGLIGQAAG